MLSRENIKALASRAGFTLCGVARARVLTEYGPRLATGLEASGPAVLGYMARLPERRLDPSTLLPGAKSVIVCALAYDGTAARDGLAAFAMVEEDYHVRIKAMLSGISERLREDTPELRGKVCCDTSAILEKAWAVEAGLGWQGRNSLLINPLHGSFLSLGELILDDECDLYDEPSRENGCGNCRACVYACPTGALIPAQGRQAEPTPNGGRFFVDTGRCISALTVERLRKGLPAEPIHGWVYGCDVCQNVCPQNKTR